MATTYDLQLVQGQVYLRGFRYLVNDEAQDLSLYSWAAQARQKEAADSELILDLTQFLAIPGESDNTTLELYIAATATVGLPKLKATAAWDLYLWPTSAPSQAVLLVQGAVTLDRAVTDLSEAL